MQACNLCQQSSLVQLLQFGDHPIAHHFLSEPLQEEYVHPVILSFCENCGLIQLVEPIPPEHFYTEYVCLSSWKHQPHAARLVELISQLPGISKNSVITEVGANDGSFLQLLNAAGYQKILGIEPAQDAFAVAKQRGLDMRNAYFTSECAREISNTYGQSDLLVARQVLEHVTDLQEFGAGLRILLKQGGYALIEVPNFEFCLTEPDYSAIWEEHVNYFTVQTIDRFLASSGIQRVHKETALFSGEALIVIGRNIGKADSIPLSGYSLQYHDKVMNYRDKWTKFQRKLLNHLQSHRDKGGSVAVYGAGSRACSLINYAGVGRLVEFVTDDQPEKQGKYMPGSRLAILPGAALEQYPIDLCLLAVNTENEKKVVDRHPGFREKGGRFASILPPSDCLLPFWHDFRQR